jgi:dienelactone hydrolase
MFFRDLNLPAAKIEPFYKLHEQATRLPEMCWELVRAMRFIELLIAGELLIVAANCTTLAHDAPPSWSPAERLVKDLAGRIPNANFDEAKVPAYELPDPLVTADGSAATCELWPARRAEVLELFREHMHGHPPVDRPANETYRVIEEDAHDLGGQATRKLVEVSFDTPHAGRQSFRLQLYLPNAAKKPVSAIVLLQFRGLTDPATPLVIERGYALAILDRTPLAADDARKYREGVINAFSDNGTLAPNAWRSIAAWAWGASRVLDYLETNPDVDAKRVAIVGFSRMGKTALWAGATDERFAAVISNESGAGGAALSKRIYGETVQHLSDRFPHWFCEKFQRYNGNEGEMPFDQHMLLACVAPRPLYVGSADEDLWSDPRGEFLACMAASPVYELLGVPGLVADEMPLLDTPVAEGRIGYHVRRGGHGFTDYDWAQYLGFLDRHLPTTGGAAAD